MQMNISPEASARIEEFAGFFGIPVEEAASKAIAGWMESAGEAMMEFSTHKRRQRATHPKLTLVKCAS